MKQSPCLLTLLFSCLFLACSELEEPGGQENISTAECGVLILCEGNFNAGNASLSYYDPKEKTVENGVFKRVNDRKLGDTGQSIITKDGTVYIAVENSGIIWALDEATLKVKGQLTATSSNNIINPRYVHQVSDTKAYVTDLYSPYINIFNPKTLQHTGSISVKGVANQGYCSTEEMVQYGKYVFVSCWSYSNKILVLDTEDDTLVDSIVLNNWQPKSIKIDCNGKLWVLTDGEYAEEYGDEVPHLYRIDAQTRRVEDEWPLAESEANVQLALSGQGDVLYIMAGDVFRMEVTAKTFPATSFLRAPVDNDGRRHKLYGIGVNPANNEIYVADAVDYAQAGMVYRYSEQGAPIDNFRVGITPNHFAFCGQSSGFTPIPGNGNDKEEDDKELIYDKSLVSKVFEFMPAPGHQVNGYSVVGDFIHSGATMEEACAQALKHFRKQYMVSLGGQGGYLIAGFDHAVKNSMGDYDLAIKGNPFSYQSEPGIIWVSKDENEDGLPNDPWYELAGSEYGTENETTGYAITYYKPTMPRQDIRWKDNQGGEGIIPYMPAWNKHSSYWQDWVPTEMSPEGPCRTYYGSRLKDMHDSSVNTPNLPPFAWGYADNLGSDYFTNPKFNADIALGYYKLCNAVTADGQPADLDCIHFVKVQTAQTGYTKTLGEISTEIYGIWDVHYQ